MVDVAELARFDGILLFDGLTPEQLSTMEKLLHQQTLPARANLMNAGQRGEAIYVILTGALKIHVAQTDGTDVIIAVLGAGDVVGEMSLLDDKRRCASVETIAETELLWLDRADFRECLRAIPTLTYNLTRILADRLRRADEQIQALTTLDVECRFARQLLAFTRRFGRATPNGDILISIPFTQSDMASLVGASREHVNKIMVSYKERKYISVDHHSRLITVRNQQAIARRCMSTPDA